MRYTERTRTRTEFKYVSHIKYKNNAPEEYEYKIPRLKLHAAGFKTAKDAAIALDKQLIKLGKTPYILKKV